MKPHLLVCCPEQLVTQTPAPPQPPRFPLADGSPRPVEDKHELCPFWRGNGGCDLDRDIIFAEEDPRNAVVRSQDLFDFMQLSCPATCGWTGDKVSRGILSYHRLEHATKPGRGLLREIFANIRLKLYSIKSNPPHSSRCSLQGCVDEHARCVEWARGGLCLARPRFMGLTCRESCGTCGFLSPFNTEEQVSNIL